MAEEQARMWATCPGKSADARTATAESWPICGEVTNIWDGDGPTLVTKGTTPFLGKISYLNFAASASVKPPTFHKVALQLVDEFALNGFQSESEPVQIWLPKESSPTGN